MVPALVCPVRCRYGRNVPEFPGRPMPQPRPDDAPDTDATDTPVIPPEPVADEYSTVPPATPVVFVSESTSPTRGDPFAVGEMLVWRYLIQQRVGTGGMGIVLRVVDQKLNRELGLKVMKPDAARDPLLVRRLLDEPRICSGLQHPGIVPLHEVDRLPDSSPFCTMKLIRGRTLHEILQELAGKETAHLVPAREVQRFVKVFEHVCQAIGFAHSQGIVHRDLKPSNVMVGAFGEVQIMDWGLAKDLATGERQPPGADPVNGSTQQQSADASHLSDQSSVDFGPATVMSCAQPGNNDATEPGHILGTLPYMPPEQARGTVGA